MSFALYIGIILANLAISGTSPSDNELFIIIDKGNERAYFKSLTNLEDTLLVLFHRRDGSAAGIAVMLCLAFVCRAQVLLCFMIILLFVSFVWCFG